MHPEVGTMYWSAEVLSNFFGRMSRNMGEFCGESLCGGFQLSTRKVEASIPVKISSCSCLKTRSPLTKNIQIK
jgi:hypothetical protein